MFIVLLLTASAILAENDKPDVADPLSLERAITLALDAHPELLAREARTHALAWIPAQRESLPDPMLSLNAMSLPTDSFDLNQEPMTQLQFGISQLIPFPGKRRLARAAAEFDASASGAMQDEVKTRLAERVRLAWWKTFSLDRSLDINTMSQSVTRQLVRSAEARYASGEGSQQDVIVAQLQLSQHKSEAVRLMGMRNSSAAILNSLVQRPVGQPVVLDRSELHRSLPEVPSSSQLQSHAMESRGILRSQRETLRAGAKRLELAALSSRPDFRLGAAYGRRGTDLVREVERPDLLSMPRAADPAPVDRATQ
ncbi:MAG: TolC family protein [Pseudomonadales bacterium]|nr:TolC family protein [Pseudomonadales bacterium]